MSSVLDLPIERQKELAKRFGMSHSDWVAYIQEMDVKFDEFSKLLDANKGIRPEGWTDEDTERFQKKIDSGNAPPGASYRETRS